MSSPKLFSKLNSTARTEYFGTLLRVYPWILDASVCSTVTNHPPWENLLPLLEIASSYYGCLNPPDPTPTRTQTSNYNQLVLQRLASTSSSERSRNFSMQEAAAEQSHHTLLSTCCFHNDHPSRSPTVNSDIAPAKESNLFENDGFYIDLIYCYYLSTTQH